MAKKKTTVLFIRNVPQELKQKFHEACVREGITMREMTLQLMAGVVLRREEDARTGAA